MVSRISGARKSENEARTRARILRGTAHGKIPVLRQTTRCQGRARDAAAPPRPASPRFPETPRPGFLGLPPGSGRARRSGPERAGARGPPGKQLRPPGRSGGAGREGSALFPGWFLAPLQRRGGAEPCAGRARGGGSAPGGRRSSERESSCAQRRQMRRCAAAGGRARRGTKAGRMSEQLRNLQRESESHGPGQ